MKRISFTVFGIPKTKGSTKSFRHPRTGKLITTSATKGLKAWEKAIYWEARRHWDYAPSTGPFEVVLRFFFAKPKKPNWSYPLLDLDKLCRSAVDSMTGALWTDDKHVCTIHAQKLWDTVNRVEIEVVAR